MASADRIEEPHLTAVPSTAENEVPLSDIPDLDQDELRTDTIEFEPVRRRTPKRRRGFRLLSIVVVLIILAGGAWAIWGDAITGGNPDEIPVIRAPDGSIKVRPETPGGIDIPNRDKLVYDRLEKKPPERQAETLLPKPEKPLPAPVANAAASAPNPALSGDPERILQPAPPAQPSQTVEQSALPAPNRPAAPPPALTTPPTVADLKAAQPSVPAPPPPAAVKPVKALSTADTSAAKPVSTASLGTGFQIQLAALRDEASATREWNRLKNRNAALLGNLQLNLVRADLGPRGIFYRLRAGPISSQASAIQLCQSLAKVKVGCLVVRPGG